MTIFLLVLHGISAMLLIGAVTHQALALWWTPRNRAAGWWHALRAVHPERYSSAVMALFVFTFALGAIVYPAFRVGVRAAFLDKQAAWGTGLFEIKEHAAAIGLALLPSYWVAWHDPAASPGARRTFTTMLACLAWWNFVIGHVVNNARGL